MTLSRHEAQQRGSEYGRLLDQWAIERRDVSWGGDAAITALYNQLVADGRTLVVGPTGTPRRDPE